MENNLQFVIYTLKQLKEAMPTESRFFTEDTSYIVTTSMFCFYGADGELHIIPPGFISDGCSIPRFLWRLLDPKISARTLEPAVIHDFGYRYQYTTKDAIDKYFYQGLVNNGYEKWKSWLCYKGVSLCGHGAWNYWTKRRKELEEYDKNCPKR